MGTTIGSKLLRTDSMYSVTFKVCIIVHRVRHILNVYKIQHNQKYSMKKKSGKDHRNWKYIPTSLKSALIYRPVLFHYGNKIVKAPDAALKSHCLQIFLFLFYVINKGLICNKCRTSAFMIRTQVETPTLFSLHKLNLGVIYYKISCRYKRVKGFMECNVYPMD